MNKVFLFVLILLLSSCFLKRKGVGDTRTVDVKYIDNYTYLLQSYSDDPTYGYNMLNPVKVGGIKDMSGPLNQRRFLNALLGPEGQPIYFFRYGSCCAFETPNGFMNNKGLLDRYGLFWEGSKDTISIYLNMYDKGNLKIPVGLNAKKNIDFFKYPDSK